MDKHLLLVKASEDCSKSPPNENFFDSSDDTQLKVLVQVIDVNDNAPKFIHRVFTGGVSTATNFGTTFMEVKAEDADVEENAQISYHLIGRIQMTLTEGLENLQRQPFLVEKDTGAVQLNFDPQQGMKGYFDFMVSPFILNHKGAVLTIFSFHPGFGQRYWWTSGYGKSVYLSAQRRSTSSIRAQTTSTRTKKSNRNVSRVS